MSAKQLRRIGEQQDGRLLRLRKREPALLTPTTRILVGLIVIAMALPIILFLAIRIAHLF